MTAVLLAAPRGRVREVVTPEGVPLRFTLADAGERAGAFLIDLVILVTVSMALLIGSVILVGAAPLGVARAPLRSSSSSACGARTTSVPPTRSPGRRRSRLKSGSSANTISQPSETSRAQPGSESPRLAGASRATSGTKNSISRVRFRANTASAVSGPPCASTTRSLSARLPGVAPFQRLSKNVK